MEAMEAKKAKANHHAPAPPVAKANHPAPPQPAAKARVSQELPSQQFDKLGRPLTAKRLARKKAHARHVRKVRKAREAARQARIALRKNKNVTHNGTNSTDEVTHTRTNSTDEADATEELDKKAIKGVRKVKHEGAKSLSEKADEEAAAEATTF